MSSHAALLDVLARETDRPLPFAVPAFVDAATKRFGSSVAAIVFYGSCRRVDQPDGLYDLYVILDDYRALPRVDAMLAAALPPNVYHLEAVADTFTRRAKCTVISRADFARGLRLWFHSYLWGRFCQPVSLAYARDASIREEMLECLATAVTKFIGEAICLQGDAFDTRALWVDGLRTSYSTELRSEGPDRDCSQHTQTSTKPSPQPPHRPANSSRPSPVVGDLCSRRRAAAKRFARGGYAA